MTAELEPAEVLPQAFEEPQPEEREKEIDVALKRADSVTLDAKKRLSKALWLTNLKDSHAEAFMDLTTEVLFELEPAVFKSLEKGRVSEKLSEAFTSRRVFLSPSAILARISSDAWLVSDQTSQYLIEETKQGIFTIQKKINEKLDLLEILEIRRHLSVEETFGLLFLNSGMCVPLELRRNLPLIVLGGS